MFTKLYNGKKNAFLRSLASLILTKELINLHKFLFAKLKKLIIAMS